MLGGQQQQAARSRLTPHMRAWVPAPGEPAYHFGYHDMHGAHLRIGDLTIQWYAWVFKGAERTRPNGARCGCSSCRRPTTSISIASWPRSPTS